jgi:hypothetical protein
MAAEFDAGRIKARLEMDVDPFAAGAKYAKEEKTRLEKPIDTKMEIKPDEASIAAAKGVLKALEDAGIMIDVGASADTLSAVEARQIMVAATGAGINLPFEATADPASITKALAINQSVASANPITVPVDYSPLSQSALKLLGQGELRGIARRFGVEAGQEYKKDLVSAIVGAQKDAGMTPISLRSSPDMATLLSSREALQAAAKADPIRIALRLESVSKGTLAMAAQQMGFGAQDIGGAGSKSDLISLMTGGALGGAIGGGGGDSGGTGVLGGRSGAPAGGATSGLLAAAAATGLGGIASGSGVLHLLLSAIPIAVSGIGAALGGGLLGAGALGVGAVGAGTDLAGIGQALGDIRKVSTNLTQIQTAQQSAAQVQATVGPQIAGQQAAVNTANQQVAQAAAARSAAVTTFGAASPQAIAANVQYQQALQGANAATNQLQQSQNQLANATQQVTAAQQALNTTLAGFAPAARPAVLAAAQQAQTFKALFDQYTGTAEATGANIINQLIKTGEQFLPTIGKFATENMKIIQTGIQPFLGWLSGAGLKIFTDLEQKFQKELPYGVNALTQAFEFVAKTIDYVAGRSGNFVKTIDDFIIKWNGVDFGRWTKEIDRLIGMWHVWTALGKEVFRVVQDLLHLEAGTGTGIVQYLTHGLDVLDKWLHTVQGSSSIHTLFEVHKEQILALLQSFGILISQVGPPLIGLLTSIARNSAPLLPVLAEVVSPFLIGLTDLLTVILKIPGVGNLLALFLVIEGFKQIPWLGIGSGFGLIIRPVERLIALPIDAVARRLAVLALSVRGIGDALAASGNKAKEGSLLSNLFGASQQSAAGRTVVADAAKTGEASGSGFASTFVGRAGPILSKGLNGALLAGVGTGLGYLLAKYTEGGAQGAQKTAGTILTSAGGGLLGLAASGATGPAAPFVALAGAAVVAAGEIVSHWGTVKAFLVKAGEDIRGAWGRVFVDLEHWFGADPAQWAMDAVRLGKDFIDGFIHGLTHNPITDAVGKIAHGVVSDFKSFFGISSPAAATIPVGTSVMDGITTGLTQGSKLTITAAENISQAIQDAFNSVGGIKAGDANIKGLADFFGQLALVFKRVGDAKNNAGGVTAAGIFEIKATLYSLGGYLGDLIGGMNAVNRIWSNLAGVSGATGPGTSGDKGLQNINRFLTSIQVLFDRLSTTAMTAGEVSGSKLFYLEATLYSLGAEIPKLIQAMVAVDKDWANIGGVTGVTGAGTSGIKGIQNFNALLGAIDYLFNGLTTTIRTSKQISGPGMYQLEAELFALATKDIPTILNMMVLVDKAWSNIAGVTGTTGAGTSGIKGIQNFNALLGSLDYLFNDTATTIKSASNVKGGGLVQITDAITAIDLTLLASLKTLASGPKGVTLGSIAVGAAVSTGIAAGVLLHEKDISDSVQKAVLNALGDTATRIQARSPSEVAARLLGDPIPQGVALGIGRSSHLVKAEMDRLLNITHSPVNIPVNARVGIGAGANIHYAPNVQAPVRIINAQGMSPDELEKAVSKGIQKGVAAGHEDLHTAIAAAGGRTN